MTGSSWICGEETLGIQRNQNANYPLGNKLSLPRTIIAQFDSIQSEIILKRSAPLVLKRLVEFIYSNNPSCWFTMYLAIFMLLHEISHSTQDRYRHARQNLAPVNMQRSPLSVHNPPRGVAHCPVLSRLVTVLSTSLSSRCRRAPIHSCAPGSIINAWT